MLLRDTLEKSGRVAVVKVALRRREALATLRVREGVITLETMLWPDEMRNPEFGFLDESVDVRPAEIDDGVRRWSSRCRATSTRPTYSDQYRAAIESVVEAKIEGRDLVPAPDTTETAASGKVVDLVAALQASIDAAKSRRGEVSESAPAAASAGKAAVEAGEGRGRRRSWPAKPAKKAAATKYDRRRRTAAKAHGRGCQHAAACGEEGRPNAPFGLKPQAAHPALKHSAS